MTTLKEKFIYLHITILLKVLVFQINQKKMEFLMNINYIIKGTL